MRGCIKDCIGTIYQKRYLSIPDEPANQYMIDPISTEKIFSLHDNKTQRKKGKGKLLRKWGER